MSIPLSAEAMKDARSAASDCREFGGDTNDVAESSVVAYLATAQPVLTTFVELAALPFESIVIDDDDDQWKHVADGEGGSYWCRFEDTGFYRVTEIDLPATVLHRPEVSDA